MHFLRALSKGCKNTINHEFVQGKVLTGKGENKYLTSLFACGSNSTVECHLPKVKVASSNLVSRFFLFSSSLCGTHAGVARNIQINFRAVHILQYSDPLRFP
jgi:hypothetical protein